MKANTITKQAESYIGIKENPANSNNVIFNTEYYGQPVSGVSYPWCCVFVWYVFLKSGASSLLYDGKRVALCQTLGDWFKKNKQFFNTPQVGDIVFFKYSSSSRWTDHVGIVKAVNGNSITTIEGNTSKTSNDNGGAVMERTRTSNIVGYGRPKYDASSIEINTESTSAIIMQGLILANRFTGYNDTNTQKAKARVLQHALNLQYKTGLVEDGIFGPKSKQALGIKYVSRGDKSYLVTAAEILLYLCGVSPKGVEYPGQYGAGLQAAASRMFNTDGSHISAANFLLMV